MHGESSPSNKADSNASKQVRAIAPWPSHDTRITDSLPCGTLKKFPVEVRFMIYRKVLEYKKHINRPHRFLGPQPPMTAGTSKYIEAIDATLLRTCKAIYREATCVLYRNNFFYFKRPSDIKAFAHFGLDTTPFGCYNNAPSGRLTLIRHLNLKLGAENKEDDFTKTWSFWSNFFYPLDELDQSIRFPALVGLNLNLKDWKLESGDASKLRVCSYFAHFQPLASTLHASQCSASFVGYSTVQQWPPYRNPA